MLEQLEQVYTLLASNAVAASIILTPLIAGLTFIITRRLPSTIYNFIISRFTTTVRIYQALDGDSFQTGEYIIAKHKLYSPFRSFILRTLWFINRPSFTTGITTTFYGVINGWFTMITRFTDGDSKYEHKWILMFTFFTRNTKALEEFFVNMDEEKERELLSGKLKLYVNDRWSSGWELIRKRNKNHIPRTTSQKNALERILKVINSPEFDKVGIMLWSEPGCGKSDLIEQIIGVTGYRLYYFNLNGMSDTNFIGLMANVKSPAIMLFEDIDCCKTTHHRTKKNNKNNKALEAAQVSDTTNEEDGDDDKIELDQAPSLSTILNVFDGVLSVDEQIIIATTNHHDKLDPALTRRGRFDVSIQLEKMTEDDIRAYIAYKYDVSEDIVAAEMAQHTVEWSAPICDITAICKEQDTHVEAVKCIAQTLH